MDGGADLSVDVGLAVEGSVRLPGSRSGQMKESELARFAGLGSVLGHPSFVSGVLVGACN